MHIVPYSDGVESAFPDEERLTCEIVAHMAEVQRTNAERHRHAHRDAHAKSHALLKGSLSVLSGLADELAQGFFAKPGTYQVVARLSSAPGDIHSDDVPAPKGFAVKILGVDGARLSPELGGANQDFLMVNIPVLAFGDIGRYQKFLPLLEHRAEAPDFVQRTGAAAARGAASVVEALGGTPGATLQGLANTNDHILGETFHTQAAIRFGNYIAKLSLAPVDDVARLSGQSVGKGHSAMRDAVRSWFQNSGAKYELRAQLCTSIDSMPVEDAAVLWDPELSPHRTIAVLEFGPQDPYSPARQVHGDDHLAFNPWNGIEPHRPLGSIMRVRKAAYESSSAQRHRLNALPRREPDFHDEIPD